MIRRLRRIGRWLADLAARGRLEREMDAEIESFLALAEDDHGARGCTPDEARRQARIELGGVEPAREQLRRQHAGAWLDAAARDVRFALRQMRRQPGFTAIAILTLGLGIGASTAVVSVVRSVLLAPLPFPESDRLVRLRVLSTDSSGRERQLSLAPVLLEAIRERSRLVEHAAAQRFQNLNLTGAGEPERIVATAVSDGWSDTLRVTPALGRTFTDVEEHEGAQARVALIGHGLWQRRFGGGPAALGATLSLDGEPYTIVGVMPAQFRYPTRRSCGFRRPCRPVRRRRPT